MNEHIKENRKQYFLLFHTALFIATFFFTVIFDNVFGLVIDLANGIVEIGAFFTYLALIVGTIYYFYSALRDTLIKYGLLPKDFGFPTNPKLDDEDRLVLSLIGLAVVCLAAFFFIMAFSDVRHPLISAFGGLIDLAYQTVWIFVWVKTWRYGRDRLHAWLRTNEYMPEQFMHPVNLEDDQEEEFEIVSSRN